MNTTRTSGFFRPALAALALAALGAAPTPALGASRDALSLVPPDATTVGFVRVADLRSNPFQLRVFEETDRLSTDGDAGRFLTEAGLNLREDVDAAVACTTSSEGQRGNSLVFFEGRFDTARLSAAIAKRGGLRQSVPGGDYFRLPEKAHGASRGPGAVAFLDAHMVVAGNEPAVVAALGARASGGTRFSSGAGLGRELHRVDPAATVWVLADVQKWRPSHTSRGDGSAAAVLTALKSVTLFTMQATMEGDAISIRATGLSADEETRGLLEDALRGVTAAWRMAAQEKTPELVAAIRKIQISHDGEGVTISGTLPGDLIRSLSAANRTRSGK